MISCLPPPTHEKSSQSDVWIMSAHAFDHMRKRKEFGLRMLFSLPQGRPGTGVIPSAPPPLANASLSANDSPALPLAIVTASAAPAGGTSLGGGSFSRRGTGASTAARRWEDEQRSSLRARGVLRSCLCFMRRFFICFGRGSGSCGRRPGGGGGNARVGCWWGGGHPVTR